MQATIEAPEIRDQRFPSVFENNGADSKATQAPMRLDFRHASGHLKEKRPGYYLILLRHEIRHRSLREKALQND